MSASPDGAPVSATTMRSRVSQARLIPWSLPVLEQFVVDAVGHPQQGELAKRGEVADAEVVAQRGVDTLTRVDVAVDDPSTQCLGSHVDEFDLVGATHDVVGDGLALFHAR